MARYRVFDEETANLLRRQPEGECSVELLSSAETFSADPGEVILAPSVKAGDVLYIRIRNAASIERSIPHPAPVPEQKFQSAVAQPEPPARHYVATGFLGLDGELEEEVPEPPKPWWKRLFD